MYTNHEKIGIIKETHQKGITEKAANYMRITIKEGNFEKLGAYIQRQTLTVTFASEKEDKCAVLFYEKNTGKEIRIEIPEEYSLGALRSAQIEGLDWENYHYNFEKNGEVYTDPYARKIVGREVWNDSARREREYRICGAFAKDEFRWKGDRHPELSKSELIIYKLHVRGFSMDGRAQDCKKGTFEAVKSKIAYLKELGVTAVEIMPIYEFEEMEFEAEPELPAYLNWIECDTDQMKKPKGKKTKDQINYWGYTKESKYFAVKEAFGKKDALREFKELVSKFHENGMELFMEMYFDEKENHNLILSALHHWVKEFHVDGFHLLGKNLPITAIVQDALLKRTKIFYTGFEYSLLEEKSSYDRLYVYNDEYLYPIRKMLNHYAVDMIEFVGQQRKQHEVQGFVNYITNNNGFTLCDLFSYEQKHNEQNGEKNTDGNPWNFSNNYGIEGKTAKKYIKRQRERQLKNAIATLFLGQAVPLLWSGDELGNSQHGNNNAYCQDNETGWVNWKNKRTYWWLTDFTKKMIAFRKEHPILTMPLPMRLSDYKNQGAPDLSYHADSAWISDFLPNQRAIGLMYCGTYAKKKNNTEDDYIYLAYNFQNGEASLALPKLPEKKKWKLVMDTARAEQPFLEKIEELKIQQKVIVKGQSVSILIGN